MSATAEITQLPTTPREFKALIDGHMKESVSGEIMLRNSPAHDYLVSKIAKCNAVDLDRAVGAARKAFDDRRWSGKSGSERAAVLLKVAKIIRDRQAEIAYWETLESGKPISQTQGEVAGCADMFEYASGLARTLHGDSFNNLGDSLFGIVTREPVGVVGVITPWNFPFLILCERVPYILASGCTIVVKPSEFTSATTVILAEILLQAGLPAGVMNVVTGSGPLVGQALCDHQDVDMVSFTGSTKVGRNVIRASGETNFKKLSLELGGKNPQIVFADADLDDAADGVAFGMCFNTGQCCVSGSRLLIERSAMPAFLELLKAKLAKVVAGDPLDPKTQMGAITTPAQNATILSYIEKGQLEGAEIAFGTGLLDLGRGQFVGPVIFTNVTPDMSIYRDEIFGPILTVTPFDSVEHAVSLANDTKYGLAASVWSKNIETALHVTRRVQAGRFWINTTLAGGAELPLGGFKQSGWGREAGEYGVEEYTQIKSVHIETGQREHWIK
ncbi:aldehyde dehydrogenase family protein [Paracoccaceae bacterium]|jgi:betaine-aldehyde dehydrogenase|nr:aldehyde dehydrogenase family protein [Paracoccaceae bacterium]MDC0540928.1 aldehyde dehydrogenase family protein [Paracoccaceae bacterium]